MKNLLCGFILAAGALFTPPVYAAAICPTTIENDPPATGDGCGILLTVNPGLSISINLTGTGPYDGASSSTYGIINDSGMPLASLSMAANGAGITAFAGNGIRGYVQANEVPIPLSMPVINGWEDYYGPQTTFSNVNFVADSLSVDFTDSLAANGTTYFSLPGVPQTAYGGLTGPGGNVSVETVVTTTPEIPVIFMMAIGLSSSLLLRRRSEA